MKKILQIALILGLLITYSQSISLFNLIPLNKTNGAMCMDGSQYGIYTYVPDTETPPNKMLIYFEDIWEGWCAKDNLNDSLARCEKYITDSNLLDYGSSNLWGGSFTTLTGILSGNSFFSPYPKILIKSCDGGSYFSDSNATFKNKVMNFRGAKNVQQVINYMNKNNLLANRQEVVITGIGNGGLAALLWADTIKANTKGKVKLLIDGGVWENSLNQRTQAPVFENRVKMLDKLFLNGKSIPNTKCQAAHNDDIAKCFYASQITQWVDSSIQILFLETYYDSWQAQEILGINCTQEFGSLSECTSNHRQALQEYHKRISSTLAELVKLPNVGAFGISCVAHFFTNGKWDNTDFSVPMGSNNTAQVVVQKWMTSKNSTETFNYLDTVTWPQNKPCSHQVKYNLAQE